MYYPGFLDEIVRQPIEKGTSLLELLSFGEGSVWWFTDTAEKSPLRTPFLNKLYNLTVVEKILSRDCWNQIRLCLDDRVLAECIESGLRQRGLPVEVLPLKRPPFSVRYYWLRVKSDCFWFRLIALRVMFAIQTIGNWITLLALGMRRKSVMKPPTAVIFSGYPALYSNPYSRHPRERNLASLIPPLRQRGPLWQVVLLYLWPWQLLRRRSQISSAFAEEQILPLLMFNTMKEWLGVFFGPALLSRQWKYGRLRFNLKAYFYNWNVSSLWRAELDRALTSPELLSNLLLCSAMRRIARTYHPRIVIHPCEFQPMERAIWAGLKGTETRSVAFQHTTVSSNTLMFFFAKSEIQKALSGEDKLATPLPDYYLTTGDWPLEIMRDAGYPAERSAVVGAVRYNDLRVDSGGDREKAAIRRQLGLPVIGKIVLVTTSSNRADCMALLEMLAAAIPYLEDSFLFLFRPHYHLRIESEAPEMFAMLAPEYWRAIDVDVPLHEYLRASDAVLLTNSTTGLEAIALSCPPIVFDNRSILNIGPLGDLRDAALFAHTPKGLAEAIQAALDPATVDGLRSAWPAALSRTFHILDGRADTRFLDFLEEKDLLSAAENICSSTKGVTLNLLET
jgi:hypothetical protein